MSKRKGTNWAEEETRTFLELCNENQIIGMMDGKRFKHVEIFQTLEKPMEERGFIKTASQMRIKLKHLKEAYYNCKRNNMKSGADRKEFPYFKLVDELLRTRPKTLAMEESEEEEQTAANQSQDETELLLVEDASEVNVTLNCTEDPLGGSLETPLSLPSTSTSSSGFSRKGNKGGCSKYENKLQVFNETFLTKQTEALQKIISNETKQFTESMAEQMRLQREWEMEETRKEREFQAMMMERMLATFSQGLNSRLGGMPMTPSHYHQPSHYQPGYHQPSYLPIFTVQSNESEEDEKKQ